MNTMKTIWKAVLAATLALAATTPWTVAAIAEHVAKSEAERAGARLEASKVRVRPGRVELDGVRAERKGMRLEAQKVVVELEGLRPKKVKIFGADVRITTEAKEGEGKNGKAKGRPTIELVESRVSIVEERGEASLVVKRASITPDGRASFFGDVAAKSGKYEAEAKGVRVKDLKIGGRVEATATSVQVKVGNQIPEKAERKAGGRREVPELSIQAERVSIEAYGRTATAERAKVGISSKSGRTTVNAEARTASVGGTTAEGLAIRVSRPEGGEEETEVEVDLAAERVETTEEKLSRGEFSVEKLRIRANVKRNPHEDKVSLEKATVQIGGAEVNLTTWLSPTEFRVNAEMPEVECQRLLDSLPGQKSSGR
jgi:hypothetical protein